MSRRHEIREVFAHLSIHTRCWIRRSSSWIHCSSCFLSSWWDCGHICMIITVDRSLSRQFHSCRWFDRCRSIVRIQIITIHNIGLSLHSTVTSFDYSKELNQSPISVLHSIDRFSLQVSVIISLLLILSPYSFPHSCYHPTSQFLHSTLRSNSKSLSLNISILSQFF